MQLLSLSKPRGCIRLPDSLTYYGAARLTRIVNWSCIEAAKRWVSIEMEDSHNLALFFLTPELSKHPTLSSTILTDWKAFSSSSTSPSLSPFTPVIGNLEFIPCTLDKHLC